MGQIWQQPDPSDGFSKMNFIVTFGPNSRGVRSVLCQRPYSSPLALGVTISVRPVCFVCVSTAFVPPKPPHAASTALLIAPLQSLRTAFPQGIPSSAAPSPPLVAQCLPEEMNISSASCCGQARHSTPYFSPGTLGNGPNLIGLARPWHTSGPSGSVRPHVDTSTRSQCTTGLQVASTMCPCLALIYTCHSSKDQRSGVAIAPDV